MSNGLSPLYAAAEARAGEGGRRTAWGREPGLPLAASRPRAPRPASRARSGLEAAGGAASPRADRGTPSPPRPRSQAEDRRAVKLLRDYGADINAPMGPGRTPPPLMAVLRRQLRALQLLIAAGSDLNRADRDGATAVVAALRRGQRQMLQQLDDGGATLEPAEYQPAQQLRHPFHPLQPQPPQQQQQLSARSAAALGGSPASSPMLLMRQRRPAEGAGPSSPRTPLRAAPAGSPGGGAAWDDGGVWELKLALKRRHVLASDLFLALDARAATASSPAASSSAGSPPSGPTCTIRTSPASSARWTRPRRLGRAHRRVGPRAPAAAARDRSRAGDSAAGGLGHAALADAQGPTPRGPAGCIAAPLPPPPPPPGGRGAGAGQGARGQSGRGSRGGGARVDMSAERRGGPSRTGATIKRGG